MTPTDEQASSGVKLTNEPCQFCGEIDRQWFNDLVALPAIGSDRIYQFDALKCQKCGHTNLFLRQVR